MIKILHLNTENGWRGGENHMRLLIEGMKANKEFENHLAAFEGSDCLQKLPHIFDKKPIFI